MSEPTLEIKLSYITGLKDVVVDELKKYPHFHLVYEEEDSIYIQYTPEIFEEVKKLRSVARAYLVVRDSRYHPTYLSNHKSILGNLIEIVVNGEKEEFKTYKISCAGSDSQEVRSLASYIEETFNLTRKEEADLKIHIIKPEDIWEVGTQITPRPLSVRDYRAVHMSGAMDSTIAYAMNSLCELEKATSYLNVFSGSATLLIEAGQCYSNVDKLVGFDKDKKHLSLSIQNMKKAGLIMRVQVKEADIYDKPDFGIFDVITSDLPFGMSIAKGEDLNKLYKTFVGYCEEKLHTQGTLVVYTSEYKILEPVLKQSRFKIVKTLELKFITSVDAYLRPKIFICKFK